MAVDFSDALQKYQPRLSRASAASALPIGGLQARKLPTRIPSKKHSPFIPAIIDDDLERWDTALEVESFDVE